MEIEITSKDTNNESTTTATTTTATMSSSTPGFDVSIIVQSAENKLQDKNSKSTSTEEENIASAEHIYQEAILDWVDHVNEGLQDADYKDVNIMYKNISDLWIAYALFFEKLGKTAQCIQAFENATQCPIAGGIGNVYTQYAKYLIRNRKPKAAQKVYLRALAGISSSSNNDDNDYDEKFEGMVSDKEERKELWNNFLELVRGNNSKSSDNDQTGGISLEELQKAVEEDHTKPLRLKRKAEIKANATTDDDLSSSSLKTKKGKIEEDDNDNDAMDITPTTTTTAPSSSKSNNALTNEQIEKASAVEAETGELMATSESSSEVVALWLVKDGDSHPLPPPPLFQASPPKLNDMSGKHLVGTEVALQLVCMQLKHSKDDINGSIVLEICRGCWALYYLMEQKSHTALSTLDSQLMKELEAVDSNLTARHSVAAGTPAEAAVQQTNDMERKEFMHQCNMRRQMLLDQIAWDFRYLLATQQQILTKAKLPYFNGISVDHDVIMSQARVCAVLHSAFYVRNKVGEDAHVKPLKKLEVDLMEQLQQEQEQISKQQQQQLPPQQPPPYMHVHNTMQPPPNSYPQQRNNARGAGTATQQKKSGRKGRPRKQQQQQSQQPPPQQQQPQQPSLTIPSIPALSSQQPYNSLSPQQSYPHQPYPYPQQPQLMYNPNPSMLQSNPIPYGMPHPMGNQQQQNLAAAQHHMQLMHQQQQQQNKQQGRRQYYS